MDYSFVFQNACIQTGILSLVLNTFESGWLPETLWKNDGCNNCGQGALSEIFSSAFYASSFVTTFSG
jgi:hypothetical protein